MVVVVGGGGGVGVVVGGGGGGGGVTDSAVTPGTVCYCQLSHCHNTSIPHIDMSLYHYIAIFIIIIRETI